MCVSQGHEIDLQSLSDVLTWVRVWLFGCIGTISALYCSTAHYIKIRSWTIIHLFISDCSINIKRDADSNCKARFDPLAAVNNLTWLANRRIVTTQPTWGCWSACCSFCSCKCYTGSRHLCLNKTSVIGYRLCPGITFLFYIKTYTHTKELVSNITLLDVNIHIRNKIKLYQSYRLFTTTLYDHL